MAVAFFVLAIVGATFTALALFAPRRPAALSFPLFMAGWVTGDLALLHVAWQLVATVVFTALGALDEPIGWAGLGVTLASWVGLWIAHQRHATAAPLLDAALRDALPDRVEAAVPEATGAIAAVVSRRQLLSPFKVRSPDVTVVRDLAYGDDKRHRLDLYRRRDLAPHARAPVLLQIHGGGWVIGDKRQQAQPLMRHLAARGWVCVAANYRRSPRATFPDHLVDCKRALAWIREHVAEHGGDPEFVAVTGGSAGGHLASLVALTANDARWQPGFESVDTRVAACVSMYGVYDFLDRHGVRGRASLRPFLQRFVMKCSPAECRDLWEAASPIAQVHADAPPFFVVHGGHDTLAWVEDARWFVEALREVSTSPVLYAELPRTQHAFDVMYTVRTAHVVHAITRWLESLRVASTDGAGVRPTVAAPG